MFSCGFPTSLSLAELDQQEERYNFALLLISFRGVVHLVSGSDFIAVLV